MGFIKERVAYLKGLAEGMNINQESNEGKLLVAMIDVMDDIAMFAEDIEDAQDELSEQIFDIDEDLAEVEEVIFGEYKDKCGDHDGCNCLEDIECPHCNEKFDIEEDMIDDENDLIECPHCHNDIDIEWECTGEDCKDED